ncbi:C25 family cysteine peptidase [Lentimicrobium sp. S6]|uniref:C25 family cysteine peptidase n=1 Tax=Lentimicrobium sp. S6 TaxID=2735872 RepID=UPI0015517C85|nr:T9SS type A sorting domain-containing protein [Lentimicrobium sp. S6]
MAALVYYPLQYNPITDKLYLTTQLEYRIIFSDAAHQPISPRRMSQQNYDKSKDYLKTQVENPIDIDIYFQLEKNDPVLSSPFMPDEFPNFNGQAVEYIIITNEALADGFQEIADWKTKKGVPALVKTVEWIYANYDGVDKPEKVRNFIIDAYQNWGTQYFMLGGDSDVVPVRYAWMSPFNSALDSRGPFVAADMYYACLDGNWNADGDAAFGEANWNRENDGTFEQGDDDADLDQVDRLPDVYIGRIPVEDYMENQEYVELENFKTKFFEYIKTSQGNENNVLLFSSMGSINHLQPAFPSTVNFTTRYNTNNYDNMDVLAEFNGSGSNNTNYHIISGLGHGGPTSFAAADGSLNRAHMDALTNTDRGMIFCMNHCSTMPWDKNTVTEHFLTAENGGIAVTANTEINWSDMVSSHTKPFLQNLYDVDNIIGTSFNSVKSIFFSSSYKDNRRRIQFFDFHLAADPEMPVWTDSPDLQNPLVLTTPTSVETGEQVINISIGQLATGVEAVLCLYKEDEVYSRENIVGTGSNISVNINCTPNTTGILYATLTAKNCLPVEKQIQVTSNNGIHLFVTDLSINGDENIDAGETINLGIELSNSGQSYSSSIQATISTADAFINIQTDQSSYSNIGGGQSAWGQSNFVFTVDNDITENQNAQFLITITDNSGDTYTDNVYLEVRAPKLLQGNRIITYTTNGNGTVESGENVKFNMELLNNSTSLLQNVTAVLTSASPYVSNIMQNQGNYGNISSYDNQTNTNDYYFTVANNYPGEPEPLIFSLEVTNNFGQQWTLDFDLLDKPNIDNINIGFKGKTTSIDLFWTSYENILGYNIYRSDTPNGQFVKLNTFGILSSALFEDIGLQELTSYYYKVSAISLTGNESELSDAQQAWTSLASHPDWFPITVSNEEHGKTLWGSPNIVDLENDGEQEIFINTGKGEDGFNIGAIFGFREDGEELYDIDDNPTSVSGFANIGISMTSTPALGDIDNDGVMEVVSATRMGDPESDATKYRVYAYKNQDIIAPFGKPDLMWEKQINYKNFNGVVLADLDGNSTLEIIIPNQKGAYLEVLDCNGNNYINPIYTGDNSSNNDGVSMPVAVDLDNDGSKEIVIGLKGGIYIYNHDGSDFVANTNPVYTDAGRMDCPVIAADIDGDGEFEIIFMSIKNYVGYVYALEANGNLVSGWDNHDHNIPLSISYGNFYQLPYFTYADVNMDGIFEILIADNERLLVWNQTGGEVLDKVLPTGFLGRCLQPLVADIDGIDDECEIILTSNYGEIYAFKYNGDPVVGWPLYLSDNTASIPLIADINGNGKNEIIASSYSDIFIWDTEGSAAMNEWGRFRLNSYNNAVYDKSCSYNPIPMEISGNASWNTERVIDSDVIINSGTLTINANVKLASLSKIIVKPGAQLIVNNAKLSNNCAEKWQGIQVWGQKDQPQESQYQGKVVLQNATIENAHEAVSLWKSGDYSSSGGMITATNTTFKNNRRSVCFMSYKNIHPVFGIESNYAASFRQCEFIADNDYILDNPFHTFLSMWEVRGVQVKGCKFINNAAFDGHALYTLNAGYRLDGFCDGATGPDGCLPQHWDKNEFLGFEKAIESSNSNQLQYAINIESSLFDANDYGIYFTGITNGATVLFNEFYVGFDGNSFEKGICNYASGRGIQLNECFNFTVEENKFFESQSNPSGNDVVGVLVNNCASEYEEIYKNEFTGLTVGNQAEGVNQLWKSKEVNFGLTYNCNINQNNTIDFYVAPDASIRSLIGSANMPAGNTFSSTNPQFKNDGLTSIDYYYNMNEPDEVLTYVSNGGWGSITAIPISSTNLCPSNYGTGGGTPIESKMVLTDTEVSQQEEVFYTNHQDFEAVSSLLNQLKDGGSTETTSLTIAAALPQDTWELRANLLGMSPYLSEDILKEASDRTDVLPESVLFEILSANPDELRNKNLMDHLENKEQPLPDYMINVLKQISTGMSAKTALVSQQSMHADLKDKAAQAIVKSIINKEEYNVVELRNWLGNLQKLESDKQIVGTYLYEEDYTSATSLLNMIPSLYELEGDDLQSFNDFKGLMNIQIGLGQQGKNIFNLSNADKAQLSDYANYSTGSAKYGAQSILSFVYGDEFCDCVSPVGKSDKGTESFSYTENDIASAIGLSVVVKPNPANVYASFDYELPIGYEKANISIINTEGEVVYQDKLTGSIGQLTLDVSNYKSGAYLYKIQVGKYTYTETLIVQ